MELDVDVKPAVVSGRGWWGMEFAAGASGSAVTVSPMPRASVRMATAVNPVCCRLPLPLMKLSPRPASRTSGVSTPRTITYRGALTFALASAVDRSRHSEEKKRQSNEPFVTLERDYRVLVVVPQQVL